MIMLEIKGHGVSHIYETPHEMDLHFLKSGRVKRR